MTWGWFFVVAIGPLIIGIALGFAFARRRYLTPREKREQQEAIVRLYAE